MLYIVSDELTATDREMLETVEPQKDEPKQSDEVDVGGIFAKIKDIKWRNSRDFMCPFCKARSSSRKKKCGRCGAYVVAYGNLDFAYKTRDGKVLGTGESEQLKQIYIKQKNESK